MRILILDDDPNDVTLATVALKTSHPDATIIAAATEREYLGALDTASIDVVIADSSVPGCEGLRSFHLARARRPHVPFLILSGDADPARHDLAGLAALGVSSVLVKPQWDTLGAAVAAAIRSRAAASADAALLEHLVSVVNALSMARDLHGIMAIVCRAARELTGADGAAFVLRDGDCCHYADEEAIGPLWKGKRFPIDECLSGWAMRHCQPAVVADIRLDARIPLSAYEPTFVRSVVMVPIRAIDPIGAIGTYWGAARDHDVRQVRVLQALADTTAVAMENVRAYAGLEAKVRERTHALAAFTDAISHDLRAPVRHVKLLTSMLQADGAVSAAERPRTLARIADGAKRMDEMLEGLLELSRTAQAELRGRPVDLALLAHEVAEECQLSAARQVEFVRPASVPVTGDAMLLRVVLQNLLGNAWKFSAHAPVPRVEFYVEETAAGRTYVVRDNGAGFEPAHASRLFGVFQRLHSQEEFPGTGVGLASARRIVEKHGGTMWATASPGKGAAFYFTLGGG